MAVNNVKLVKDSEPQFEILAEICKIIQGTGTAAALAERAQVNAGTISRILNGKISSSVSVDTMMKLAKLITPDMNITEERLFEANGYHTIGKAIETQTQDYVLFKRKVKDIIHKEIAYREGFMTTYSENNVIRFGETLSGVLDILFIPWNTKAQSYDNQWGIVIPGRSISFATAEGKNRFPDAPLRGFRRGLLESLAKFTLIALQCLDEKGERKYRFFPSHLFYAIADEAFYKDACVQCSTMRFPFELSLVHVDIEHKKIDRETQLKKMDDSLAEPYFIDNNKVFINEFPDDYFETHDLNTDKNNDFEF